MELAFLLAPQWRRRPGRCLLSLASVAIAVASILATIAARNDVRTAYARLAGGVDGPPALEIVAAAGGRFDGQRRLDLGDMAGIRAQTPVLTRAILARVNGKRLRGVALGMSPAKAGLAPVLAPTAGSMIASAGDVVLAEESARALGARLGDRLTLLSRRGPRALTIVGLAPGRALETVAPGAQLVLPLQTLQELFGLEGQVDRIRVLLADRASREEIRQQIARRLPSDLAVQAPLDQSVLLDSIMQTSGLALQFACALSIVMAAFIVFNSLRMNFGERRHELALLQLLGATQRQLARLYLAEGLILGLVGAAVGAPLGIVAAKRLAQGIGALTQNEISAVTVLPLHVAAASLGGIITAAVAAALPAWHSRQIRAREALEGAPPRQPDGFPWISAAAGAASWLVAAVTVTLIVREQLSPPLAIPAGLLMLIGFVLMLPALLKPLLAGLSALASPLLKHPGELAVHQLSSRRDRTGLTVGVIVVAVSNGLGLGNAILTNIDEVREWYRRSIAGEAVLIDPNPAASTGASRPLAETLKLSNAVAAVQQVNFVSARLGGMPVLCVVRDFSPNSELPWMLDPAAQRALRADLARGEIVLGQSLGRKLGVSAGDAIRAELRGRSLTFRVAAMVTDFTSGGMVAFLDRRTAAESINLGSPDMAIVQRQAGASSEELIEALSAVAQDRGLIVRTFAELQSAVDRIIDGVVGSLWGLMAVGFVVAGFAVGNTLNITILEQTRELGLLRVIGMTRGQIARLILVESSWLALAAIICGSAAGITTAWIIHLCSQPLLGYRLPFELHVWLVVGNIAGCAAIGLLAAWPGIRRAQAMNALEAIAYE